MAWELDFTGETVDSVDKSGGHPPDDYYRVKLVELPPQTEKWQDFIFQITSGLHTGRKVKGRLFDPRFSDTPERADGAKRKAKLWAGRLGLMKKEHEGKNVPIDWNAAIGWTGVVLQATPKDKDTGKPGKYPEVDYAGIFPIEHVDLDGPTRTRLGLALLPGQSATAPEKSTRGKKDDATTTPQAPAANSAEIAAKLWG